MTEKETANAFIKERACALVESATKAYFATPSASPARMNGIIEVEDAQRLASFMGVEYPDILRAYLRGTPVIYRQDYLDTIYDEGILFGRDAEAIAQEFGLTPPTLGL